MEHAEAIEHIELAAVEPDGLERLMAGDTPEGAAVAGHLAGCPACVDELARISRTSAIVREVLVAVPDPGLRERTLEFVRTVGRDRAVAAPGARAEVQPAGSMDRPTAVRRRWLRLGTAAAVIALAAGLGFGLAAMRSPEPALHGEVTVLESATREALRVGSQPDARQVSLVATEAAGGASGSLVFSPSMGELVMVAEGLPPLAPGEEYGCWVETGGTRTRIGRMDPGGGMHAWAGPVDGLANLSAGAVFGVSRVPGDGGGSGQPVLVSNDGSSTILPDPGEGQPG